MQMKQFLGENVGLLEWLPDLSKPFRFCCYGPNKTK